MPKEIELKANELSETSVSFISLVDKGANRTPFRIIKSENPEDNQMKKLDLSNVQNLMRKASQVQKSEVEIVAIATSLTGEGLVTLKADLKAEGIVVGKAFKSDDTNLLIVDTEADLEDSTTLQLTDTVSLVVKGFDPYISNQENTSFSEAMAGEGFFMGVYRACGVLENMLTNNIYDMNSKDDIAKYAESLVDDFKGYVTNLVYQLPQKAFKIADKVAKIETAPEPKQETTPIGQSQVDGQNTQFVEAEVAKDPAISGEVAIDATETPLTPEQVQGTIVEGQTVEKNDVSPVTADVQADNMDVAETTETGTSSPKEYDVEGQIKSLQDQMATFTSSIETKLQEVLGKFESISTQVVKSEEKLDKTLAKTTIGAVSDTKTVEVKEKTVKSSEPQGLLDTGFAII